MLIIGLIFSIQLILLCLGFFWIRTHLDGMGKTVQIQLNENLKLGFHHFEKIQQHLHLTETKLTELTTVGQSMTDLTQLLKLPHLRGSFGEATLERLLADFLPLKHYELQYALSPLSTERIDAVVKFGNQLLPIDSKFPREQILPLFDSQEPHGLEIARKALADYIKAQAKSIATKYIHPEHGTLDMAFIFLPSETLYFEVIRNGTLFEHLVHCKVFPISPNTLAIALKSIAIAQEYYQMAQGIEKTILDVKKAKKHFQHFETQFEEIGKDLRKAQTAFDKAHQHLAHYELTIEKLTLESDKEPKNF